MTIRIGRLGLEVEQSNVGLLDASGRQIRIEGRLSAGGGTAVNQLREQVLGLADNPHEVFYPVVYDASPYINGYYTVDSAEVGLSGGSLQIGHYEYRISLTRIPSSSNPLMEARLLGSVRGNFLGVEHCYGWEAVPDAAVGYSGANAYDVRQTSDGRIRVYSNDVDGLLDSYTSWGCPPENWYDGSARIRVGLVPDLQASTFFYTGAAQSYVVPDDVTKLLVDVRGAQGGGYHGGRGGRTRCVVDVTPGETLTVRVGGRGGLSTGGFNGGGSGGAGSVAGTRGYGTSGDGYGGGGATDVRQGGTTLAERVVVAGGGGGMGGANPIGRAGFRGGAGSGTNGLPGANPEGSGGLGGTATAGGATGRPAQPTFDDGTAGSLGTGGNGANAHAMNYYGAAGGGGGYYGGGGGSESGYLSSAGSGGGGSGYAAGENVQTSSNYQAGSGLAVLIPVIEEMPVDRYTVVGEHCPANPYGWELNNGLLSVEPVYDASQVAFRLRLWNGEGWSDPRRWVITSGTTGTPVAMRLSSLAVLRNSPEEAIIRATAEYNDRVNTATLTLTLRRGSPLVDVRVTGVSTVWGIRCVEWTDSEEVIVGSFVQSDLEDDGVGILASSAFPCEVLTTFSSGYYLLSAGTQFSAGVGFYSSGFTPSAERIVREWWAAQTELVQAVKR